MKRCVILWVIVGAVGMWCGTNAAEARAIERLMDLRAGSGAATTRTAEGALALVVDGSKVSTARLFELEKPGITRPSYAVVGEVKGEDVAGPAYLEMWSFFPDGGRYFTRTMAPAGPLGKLSGTFDWRAFELPFQSEPGRLPTRIEVSVVGLQGGKVYLRSAKLIDGAGPGGAARSSAWWSDRQGGMIGGVLGTAIGCVGALIGILSGLGRNRFLVMSLLIAMLIASVLLLLVGVAALMAGQPRAVWYPLGLTGLIGTIVMPGLIPVVRRRYVDLELRRIGAMDAG